MPVGGTSTSGYQREAQVLRAQDVDCESAGVTETDVAFFNRPLEVNVRMFVIINLFHEKIYEAPLNKQPLATQSVVQAYFPNGNLLINA